MVGLGNNITRSQYYFCVVLIIVSPPNIAENWLQLAIVHIHTPVSPLAVISNKVLVQIPHLFKPNSLFFNQNLTGCIWCAGKLSHTSVWIFREHTCMYINKGGL